MGALFWATTAAVLANVLAPACHRPVTGIGLQGVGAQYVGMEVAAALGCVVQQVWDVKTARQALLEEHAHDWPSILRVNTTLRKEPRRLLMAGDPPENRNCVMELGWWMARAKALGGDWNIIRGEQSVTADDDLLRFARRLVPAYLLDISRRRLYLDHWSNPLDCYVAEVLRDLARFVESHGGDPQRVLEAREHICPAGQQEAMALADILTRLTWEGKLDVATEDDVRDGHPAVIQVPESDGLFLADTILAKALRDKCVEAPSHDQVARALADAGTLIEDRGDGWVFQREWVSVPLEVLYRPIHEPGRDDHPAHVVHAKEGQRHADGHQAAGLVGNEVGLVSLQQRAQHVHARVADPRPVVADVHDHTGLSISTASRPCMRFQVHLFGLLHCVTKDAVRMNAH